MVWAWMLWSPYALETRTSLWFWAWMPWSPWALETTNIIMVWAWMPWSLYALGTRAESWFEHGCCGHRMLFEHERYHGLGMDALVNLCSWKTNENMVWAWMLWSPYALGTRTELWFWHGCSGYRMLSEHERYYGLGTDLGMDALVTVCSSNTNVIMAWAWMLWSPYALGTRTELWFWHGCCGHRMLLEHERNHGLGMDALVIVCSWNTNVIMVWARMLWSSYALRTRTLSWLGYGCSGHRMLFEHERYHGLGMDALVTVCSWNTNGIMVLAWMLWSSYALRTRTSSWLGHGCSGHRMLLEHVRYYGHLMVWPWTKSKCVYCLKQSTNHRMPK